MSITKKKYKPKKIQNFDVYFSEYLLAVEIDEKVILAETLFLRRKDKKRQKKKLGRKFIRINTSKRYD